MVLYNHKEQRREVKMKTISKELAKKVMANGWYDTKNYRYVAFEGAGRICRVAVDYLGTTEALDWRNYEEVGVRK